MNRRACAAVLVLAGAANGCAVATTHLVVHHADEVSVRVRALSGWDIGSLGVDPIGSTQPLLGPGDTVAPIVDTHDATRLTLVRTGRGIAVSTPDNLETTLLHREPAGAGTALSATGVGRDVLRQLPDGEFIWSAGFSRRRAAGYALVFTTPDANVMHARTTFLSPIAILGVVAGVLLTVGGVVDAVTNGPTDSTSLGVGIGFAAAGLLLGGLSAPFIAPRPIVLR